MRLFIALCFAAFVSLMAVAEAQQLPYGQPIISDDTFAGTMLPDTPITRNKRECYIERRGIIRIENMRQSYPDRFGKGRVPYVVVQFERPTGWEHTNTCESRTRLWVEEEAMRNILKRQHEDRLRALSK